ncbi:MAG: hypothetical protein GX072_03630 [Lysinibacillus sp.]|nr:hypothetical protein [Lysinibacillus sp.]
MNNVIDFITTKKKKQEEQLTKLFSKANTFKNREEIDKLVDEKKLAVNDHKLFLAFLAYLEDKNIESSEIFKAVLTLPKHEFELKYEMNWFSVVQLCFTFLTILKENDVRQYEQFLSER